VPENIVFDRATLLARLTTEYNKSLNVIPDGPPKTFGIAAGNAAAEVMIAARQDDGRFTPSPWVANYGPGHWQPLLDANGRPILDPTAWVANVRPFLHIALFWGQNAGGPALIWNRVARNLVGQYAIDLGDSAFLFATMNLSAADAVINCWNDKYYWDFWRPWTAIQQADRDGNPDTEPDPSWTPLLTAPYPEHPSGHLSLDGAALEALKMFFGTNQIRVGVTSSRFPGEIRYYDRFSDALNEIVDARIWAGLHFRTADIQAKILGRKVAHYMATHYFQPLQ
jgi:hypothetical protein